MPHLLRPPSPSLRNKNIERHATWLEIFFDLIFVVIVTQISARLSHHLTYIDILQSMALFIPVIWTWVSYTVFAARFDNNDFIHWGLTFVTMFAAAIMAVQIPTALESGGTGFAIGFLIAQISLLLLYARFIPYASAPKNLIFFYLIGFSLGVICWILSLFYNPPIKFALWAMGMCIYLSIPWLGRKRILSKAPLDTTYIPERFGAFTVIILGQTIASVVVGLESAHWYITSIIISVAAFVLAILIWGQYYRFTKIADYKCTLSSGQPYIYTHIPLILSLVLIGVCVEDFIKTTKTTHEIVKIIFCFASMLWLTSFYLLQYIAIRQYRIRGLMYLGGMIAIFIVFMMSLSTLSTIVSITAIFGILFFVQYRIGERELGVHIHH